MPQIMSTLDEIAIEKQRDVLFLDFGSNLVRNSSRTSVKGPFGLSGFNDPDKSQAIIKQWLDDTGIPYEECYPPLDPGMMSCPYLGHLYIDIAYDESDPTYRSLAEFLQEEGNGKTRFRNVTLCLFSLRMALKLKRESYSS